jgi:hypothetical protein
MPACSSPNERGYALGVVAGKLGHEASDWSELAEAAGLSDPDIDLPRVILSSPGRPGLTAEEAERERLKALLGRLKAFQRTSKLVAKALEADLRALDVTGTAIEGDSTG